MLPSTLLGTAEIPGTNARLRLYQRGDEFSIKIPGRGELMNSRVHGSEIALAELACARISDVERPRILIGGLGMGFTLAAALRVLDPGAELVVAELVPEVVEWNRQAMGDPAGQPLKDPRVSVFIGDVCEPLRQERQAYDAILLDVDNGPEALIRRENDWLYTVAGLETVRRALRPGGVLAVWSASADQLFTSRLKHAGFSIEEVPIRPHHGRKRTRHHIWLAA